MRCDTVSRPTFTVCHPSGNWLLMCDWPRSCYLSGRHDATAHDAARTCWAQRGRTHAMQSTIPVYTAGKIHSAMPGGQQVTPRHSRKAR